MLAPSPGYERPPGRRRPPLNWTHAVVWCVILAMCLGFWAVVIKLLW